MIYRLSKDGEVRGAEEASVPGPLSCALGCFDGVHAGHRVLIKAAEKNFFGYTPAVWTFSEPLSLPFIENVNTRLSLCGTLGIETAICEDFETVRNMSPEQFIRHMINDFGVKHFICGSDFRFGLDRSGDAETLKTSAASLGAAVTVVPPLTVESLVGSGQENHGAEPQAGYQLFYGMGGDWGEKISSSMLRTMIAAGEVEKAAVLLGRRFGVTGKIRSGHQIGRKMGLPTINQRFEPERVIPAFGVYYSLTCLGDKEYPSVTNIGSRPTVNSDGGDITCETHILECDADLYGQTVRVELCRMSRPEMKFPGLEQLKNAITEDVSGARRYFGLDISPDDRR